MGAERDVIRVDPRCRDCGRGLLDEESRRRRYGPDCWERLTPEEQELALELAAAERDPHYIPPERPPSATARINHRNVQALTGAPAARLCRHGQPAGSGCPACRREADPTRAAELILRDVRAQPLEERRAERIAVLERRYEHGPPPVGRRPPKPRPTRRTPPPGPATQLELL